MDPLSQVIALLKPQVVSWRLLEGCGDWTLRFPETELVAFGQLIEGGGEARLGDGTAFEVAPGDFLLLASPRSWTMRSGRGAPDVDLKALLADPTLLSRDASGPRATPPRVTRFLAGAFAFSPAADALLRRLMPSCVHVRGKDVASSRLGSLLSLLGDEAVGERPGRVLVLDRLLEILLMEVLRRQQPEAAGPPPGLLAGLADQRVGPALQALHADARRRWTVDELARCAGMSRSAFAARFAAIVGAPPIDYLSNWRLSLAKSALAGSKRPMADVAELAGYASVSAFSTAFSRATGCSPTAFSRQAQRGEAALA